jgi:hypothetical protein
MPEVMEQEKELKTEALTIVQKASAIVIRDQTTYNSASALLLQQIIPFRKRWAEYWSPLKAAAWEAHKSIMAKFNEGDVPAAQAEMLVKSEISRWDIEQRRIEADRQRKAQEEAERVAKEEQLKAAIAAEQSGASKEEVEDIFDAPVAVVAAPVAPVYNRASGVSTRESWECTVTDIKKLCLAVAKGQVSPEYVLPNMAALNARARADKRTMNIPGCIAQPKSIVAGRVK